MPTCIADIWSGLTPVEINCGAGSERCSGGMILLAQDRRLLEIFFQVPCLCGIIGSESTSIDGNDAPDLSPRKEMPCGSVGGW